MKFAEGDSVVWLQDGQEIPAIVVVAGTRQDETEFYHIEVEGDKKIVEAISLLAPKKPGFEVRDLALVLTESKDAVQGEVVATGIGPKNRTFYQLKFEPEIGFAQSWYSEDEVFTVSDPKKKTIPRVTVL
jgi:hypothetical protein